MRSPSNSRPFGYEKIVYKMDPTYLYLDQNDAMIEASRSIFTRLEKGSYFWNRVVSTVEIWIHTQQQSMEWKHSGLFKPKKCGVQKSAKTFLLQFFGLRILIYFLDNGKLIAGTYYSTSLTTSRENILQGRRQK